MLKCKVGQILLDTYGSEREALAAALENKDAWSSKALANAVNKTRFSVGSTTIKEHRRESCRCYL